MVYCAKIVTKGVCSNSFCTSISQNKGNALNVIISQSLFYYLYSSQWNSPPEEKRKNGHLSLWIIEDRWNVFVTFLIASQTQVQKTATRLAMRRGRPPRRCCRWLWKSLFILLRGAHLRERRFLYDDYVLDLATRWRRFSSSSSWFFSLLTHVASTTNRFKDLSTRIFLNVSMIETTSSGQNPCTNNNKPDYRQSLVYWDAAGAAASTSWCRHVTKMHIDLMVC